MESGRPHGGASCTGAGPGAPQWDVLKQRHRPQSAVPGKVWQSPPGTLSRGSAEPHNPSMNAAGVSRPLSPDEMWEATTGNPAGPRASERGSCQAASQEEQGLGGPPPWGSWPGQAASLRRAVAGSFHP